MDLSIAVDLVPIPGRLFWFALFPRMRSEEEGTLMIQDWMAFYTELLEWLNQRQIQIERHHHFTAACLPPPLDFEMRMAWG